MKNSLRRPRRSVSQPNNSAPSTAPAMYTPPARPMSKLLMRSSGLAFSAPDTEPAKVTSRPSSNQVIPSANTSKV